MLLSPDHLVKEIVVLLLVLRVEGRLVGVFAHHEHLACLQGLENRKRHRVLILLLLGLEDEEVERLKGLLIVLHPVLSQVQVLVLILDILNVLLV